MALRRFSRRVIVLYISLLYIIIWNKSATIALEVFESGGIPFAVNNSDFCENRVQHLDKLSTLLQSELIYVTSKNEELKSTINNLLETCSCTQCLHHGHYYDEGDIWEASSCTTCTCQAGEVNCDEIGPLETCTESPCSKVTCLNGGRCRVALTQNSFECECPLGFTGPLCELVTSQCMLPKSNEFCDQEVPVWYYDRRLQRCEFSAGCYSSGSSFDSFASCSSTCTEGSCCYRRKPKESKDENLGVIVCQEESMVDCRSLCSDGQVDVVGFYPGTHCLNERCQIHDTAVCHTGTALLWPGSTFTIGCDSCECQRDQISCRCSTMTLRKEIRDMSSTEIVRYKRAVAELQKNGSESIWITLQDLYTTFIMHSHTPSYYLFWHRLFLRTVERQLQETDCSVSIPYFDFTLDAANLSSSNVWIENYFGGNKNFSSSCLSQNGSFEAFCRKRMFRVEITLPSMLETSIALAKSDFYEFTIAMQNIAGYVLSYTDSDHTSSPLMDPVFYSIHAYIDMLFWRWQQKHQEHIAKDGFRQDMSTLLIPFNTALIHVVDSEMSLCVSYWGPSHTSWVSRKAEDTKNAEHDCFLKQDKISPVQCLPDPNKSLLDIGRRIQEILYTQTERFLKTLPRTCPGLQDLPQNFIDQIWTELEGNIKTSTNFQQIDSLSELGKKFCFTADIFVPDDKDPDSNELSSNSCSKKKIAVCDVSLLSTCPYYPHYPCKLSICGNCSVTCHVNGQDVDCGPALQVSDFCHPNPCKNGGRCIPSRWLTLPHLVSCQCLPTFIGEHCEHQMIQPCFLPLDSSNENCDTPQKRWYFNVKNQDCHPFMFGGCLGNANNFLSYYDCRVTCIIGACCWRQPLTNKVHGYSENGFDRYGFNIDGFSIQNERQTSLNSFGGSRAIYRFGGFDHQGYNQKGLNSKGLDRFGYGFNGYHHLTRFNILGFNTFGDYDGLNNFKESEHDADGFNRAGLDCHGRTRDNWDYYGLATGWSFDCRATSLSDCQNVEHQYPNTEVISFSQGKKCEEVNCGENCGCNFMEESFTIGSKFPLGCSVCKCERAGHVVCPCNVKTVRKEIRDLSSKEISRYQAAIQMLHDKEFTSSVWLNMTRLYVKHYPLSHGNTLFLPWHRFFLRIMEMKLQEIDCTLTIPYYDWTMDSGNPENSVVWQANVFGGDGSGNTDNCVSYNPFKKHSFLHWSPCLRRNFNTSIKLPDAVDIEIILRETSYNDFRFEMEKISSLFHLFVGGHMASPESAYDPIFFSHYAFVDKLWNDWEISKHTNVLSFPPKLRYTIMVPFSVRPDDVLLNEQQMCVSYIKLTEGRPCEPSNDSVADLDHNFDSNVYDKDGFNVYGYDISGFDRMGWTKNGFFRDSFNRDGFDASGFDRNGYNRYGFDKNGCNSNGYCSHNSSEPFDTKSYALNSFNSLGYNALGLDSFGFDIYGFSPGGQDRRNCSFFKNGPFYPLLMKNVVSQLAHLSNAELHNIMRICPQLSGIQDWWISLSWMNRQSLSGAKLHKKRWFGSRPLANEGTVLFKNLYHGWLAPMPDDRFCFPLHHFSRCPLNKPPIPCPLQNCNITICPTKPTAICRKFGCGSCDSPYYDVILQKPVACEVLKCISMDGKVRREGDTWNEESCKKCTCEQGHITCVMIECKEICHHPIRSSDSCCPICDGCEYETKIVTNGENFMPSDNPCLDCTCINGTVHCVPIACPAMRPCKKEALVTLPGKCCPVCSMCGPRLNGSQWMESPCHNCQCHDGKVHCFTIDCPLLSCQNPWRPHGECCRRCDGCEYQGKVFKSGEMFKQDACTECECQSGSMICQSTTCPVLQCREPKELVGHCCPVCEDECKYDGQTYLNGEVFVPKFNPCMNCSCMNSIVRCLPVSCPDLDSKCKNPTILPGSCCPSCSRCVNGSKIYENGERWKFSNDPCESCTCMNGIILCSKTEVCEKMCSHGIVPKDECCSPCIDCAYDGRPVMNHMQFSPPNDPCTRCTCLWGTINCLRESCPRLLCHRTELPAGACCPVCKGCIGTGGRILDHGSQWVHPSDICQICSCQEGITRCERVSCNTRCSYPIKKVTSCCPDCNGCQIKGQIFENGSEVPSDNICSKCTCYNGNLDCESIACPPVTCSQPKSIEGRCCTVCEDCELHGQNYANGEIFFAPSDPCYNCSCEMGIVACQNMQKICNPQCNHPEKVSGQCCPLCDGCEYEGRSRKNGEKFPMDPTDHCRFCECINGNVLCSTIKCPELKCRDPIKVSGECCHVCPAYCVDENSGGIHETGDVWTDAQNYCRTCRCENGVIQCDSVTCSQVLCSHPTVPVGECCPSCDNCEFTRHQYSNGEEFSHVDDPCLFCKCMEGNVSCVTIVCDPVQCLNPQRVDGHCCPVCLSELGCNYLGEFYEPWENFIDPLAACTECVCIDGIVNCHESTCAEASCPNPLSGHCCSSCNGCSYGERNYVNDLLFEDPYNSCRQCYCDTGQVSCQPKACPPIMCQHPIIMDNECCPTCQDCFYNGQLYENGETFSDPNNLCLECQCEYPLVHCQPLTCPPVKCSHPSMGTCCESCTDCLLDGVFYIEGSRFPDPRNACRTCICQDGNITCLEKLCPDIKCNHPVENGCCEDCEIGCWINGSLYTHWQVFPAPDNPCNECRCQAGNITCKEKTCPRVDCKHPSKKHCCPECSDCFYMDMHILNGMKIQHDTLDFCEDCACINGDVKCQPKLCPVVECANPVFEECCPKCNRGCFYEEKIHLPGVQFDSKDDPCLECLCIDGNVHCNLKSCDSILCKDEVAQSDCCSHCSTYCTYSGSEYQTGEIFPHFNNSCFECQCFYGIVECSEKLCPPANCLHPVFENCCLVCNGCYFDGKTYPDGNTFENLYPICENCQCKKGTVECQKSVCAPANCTHSVQNGCCFECSNCNVSGKIYHNGETVDSNKPCQHCKCENGTVACSHVECESLSCEKPVVLEGACCPICPKCVISGIRFEENSIFPNPENPCEKCICKEGQPLCEKEPCPLDCAYPLPGNCCPICNGCLFEDNVYDNNQEFNPDKCRSCQCKDGNVLCVSEICPKLECSLKTLEPGECCPTCRGCVYEGTEYISGNSWISSANPCLKCHCGGGTITCSEIQCRTTCTNPRPVPGSCCPVCPECELNGEIYPPGKSFIPSDDPCKTCTCEFGEVICITQQCPILHNCSQDSVRPPQLGECCPTCAGFSSSCTREQIGRLEYPTQDPCFVCQCTEDYMWTCSKEICPSLYCPKDQIIQSKKHCCQKCKVCASLTEEDFHPHGSTWQLNSDPCINCSCDYGLVKCDKLTCPPIQCNSGETVQTAQSECCPACIGVINLECYYGDILYQNGQKWTPDPCTVCQCIGGKMMCHNERCLPLTCPSDQILSVDPGKCCPKCIPRPASCIAFGDPHYRTFDGATIDFQGTCRYILAADCYTQLFSVIVENADRGLKGVSWTERVVLVLQNGTVDLRKGPTVYVKGKPLKHLPYFDDPILYIENTGSSVLVTTNIGVNVLWNGDSFVEVVVSGTFRDKTCGLCGNFNNFPEDDLQMPTGEIAISDAKFGNSWKNRGAQPKHCEDAIDLDPCNEGGYRARKNANTKCSILKSSTFALCHQFIPPEAYFAACVYDMCACSENDDCLCDILSSYSHQCAKAGVILNWRSAGLCVIGCSEKEGLVFDECGPPCPRTCENRDLSIGVLASQCFKPCVPGCQCSADKVLHNGRCIHPKNCP